MRFIDDNEAPRYAIRRDSSAAQVLAVDFDIREAAARLRVGQSFTRVLQAAASDREVDVDALMEEGRLLTPVPEAPAGRCLVTGTGLTHFRSAEVRNGMNAGEQAGMTDSMSMYRSGEKGGRPRDGEVGAQPEWFFKGTGQCLVASGSAIHVPHFSLSAGEEVELAGVYYIDEYRNPRRIGFALANDFSDHLLEEKNYLYVAVSKLRPCAIGPELVIGDVPQSIVGRVAVHRGGKVLWESEFMTGEANMLPRFFLR